jgi:HK97 family phage major capsid protein
MLSVDAAYRHNRAGWMLHDTTLRVVMKLKDAQNRPLLIPTSERMVADFYSASLGVPEAQTPSPSWALHGFPVWANNDMATPAANAKTILFGDLSRYVTRDALDVTLFRLADSAYAKLGQVGFLAFVRSGGNLVDTGAVKYYQHSAT